MVSKIMCFFAEEDKIWKRAAIKKKRGDFKFKGSWKRTGLVQDLSITHKSAIYDREHEKPLPCRRLTVPEGLLLFSF